LFIGEPIIEVAKPVTLSRGMPVSYRDAVHPDIQFFASLSGAPWLPMFLFLAGGNNAAWVYNR